MKILYSFIVGVVVGGGTMFLFLNKSTPIQSTMTVTSSNPKAKISKQQLEVKTKRKTVEATASFETDRKGSYTNTITINRRTLQYKHDFYLQTGYLINSQTPLLEIGYSYNTFLINTKLGYSFKLQTIDYGIGIGIKYSF